MNRVIRSVSQAILVLALLSLPSTARSDGTLAISSLVGLSGFATAACWTATLAEQRGESRDEEPDEDSFTRRGILVAASLAYAHATSESDLEPDDGNLSLKNSFGLKARAGYRCHRYLSADFQAEWIEEFDGTVFPKGAGARSRFDVRSLVFTSNLRAYLPLLGDRMQPFALVGAGVADMKTKRSVGPGRKNRETEFAVRVGGGVDFYITPNVVVTLDTDWVRPFGSLDDYDYVSGSVGAQYRF